MLSFTYHGTKIDGPTSSLAKSLPDWAPAELKDIEEQLPKQLDWVNEDYNGGVYSKNGRTLQRGCKLYLLRSWRVTALDQQVQRGWH